MNVLMSLLLSAVSMAANYTPYVVDTEIRQGRDSHGLYVIMGYSSCSDVPEAAIQAHVEIPVHGYKKVTLEVGPFMECRAMPKFREYKVYVGEFEAGEKVSITNPTITEISL